METDKLVDPEAIPYAAGGNGAGGVAADVMVRDRYDENAVREKVAEAIADQDDLFVAEIAGQISVFHVPGNDTVKQQFEKQQRGEA